MTSPARRRAVRYPRRVSAQCGTDERSVAACGGAGHHAGTIASGDLGIGAAGRRRAGGEDEHGGGGELAVGHIRLGGGRPGRGTSCEEATESSRRSVRRCRRAASAGFQASCGSRAACTAPLARGTRQPPHGGRWGERRSPKKRVQRQSHVPLSDRPAERPRRWACQTSRRPLPGSRGPHPRRQRDHRLHENPSHDP